MFAIDDNLVLKPKDTCWIDFWLENQHLPLWRQRQIVKSCGKKIWIFEFQQNLARESYQRSQLDCWLSTNSKNLRVFASIETLEAKLVFMKISQRHLSIYGCLVSQYHEKTNRNIFLPKCPEIDDTLVLKQKKLLASFWLKNHQLTSWRQEQIVSAAGRKLRNLNFNIILLGKTFKGPNWTVSCQKIQKTRERGEITKIWTSANLALGSGKLSEVLFGLVVPKKLEKTERNCPNKNIGDCHFH